MGKGPKTINWCWHVFLAVSNVLAKLAFVISDCFLRKTLVPTWQTTGLMNASWTKPSVPRSGGVCSGFNLHDAGNCLASGRQTTAGNAKLTLWWSPFLQRWIVWPHSQIQSRHTVQQDWAEPGPAIHENRFAVRTSGHKLGHASLPLQPFRH